MRKLIAVLGEFGFANLGLTEKAFLVPGSIIQLGSSKPLRGRIVGALSSRVRY